MFSNFLKSSKIQKHSNLFESSLKFNKKFQLFVNLEELVPANVLNKRTPYNSSILKKFSEKSSKFAKIAEKCYLLPKLKEYVLRK